MKSATIWDDGMNSILVCALVLLSAPVVVSGQETLLMDGFDDPEASRQLWEPTPYTPPGFPLAREKGTGTITFRDGFAFLNTTDQTKADGLAIAALSSTYQAYKYTSLETRLRCSDDNGLASDIGAGFRFWGFWDYHGGKFLYFQSASNESREDRVGFRAVCGNSGLKLIEPITGIDMREWHTYTILWDQGNATFIVDGEVVATTNDAPKSSMALVIGNSNRVPHNPGFLIDVPFNQSIQVDYVHLFSANESALLSLLSFILLPAVLKKR
jgi:hypothetical protein